MAGNQSKSGLLNRPSLARRIVPDTMVVDDYLNELLKTMKGLKRAVEASRSIAGKIYAEIRAEEKRGER